MELPGKNSRAMLPLLEELEDKNAEIAQLRAFAQAVMEVWPMGDLDGGTLQEIAEKHGMLKPETRHEPCGEVCSCNEYAAPHEWEYGVVCYRKTPLLKGSNSNDQRRLRPLNHTVHLHAATT